MYTEYFGLERRPFQILPDSHFMFLSEQHSRAIANIKFALANKDCFVVITGEIGVGKTTILNNVLKTVDSSIAMARLTHTSLSPVELLQAVLLAFDQPVANESKVILFDQIRKFLLQMYAEGKHVVIAVDEAQNLGSAALEELRLLTCIEADTKELLTVVLMGQPALSDLINTEALHNLRQRTRLRQHLRRLSSEEVVEYLKHRLRVAGGEYEKIFEHDAVALIHDVTRGTPRLINTLCDTALTATSIRSAQKVTKDCVEEVLEELGWQQSMVIQNPCVLVSGSNKKPSLEIYLDGILLSQVPVLSPVTIIGRCESNHIRIHDQSISRRHAAVSHEKGTYRIEDLGSVNNTLLNGEPCGRSQVPLQDGDRILVAKYTLIFREARVKNALEDENSASVADLPMIDLGAISS